ncbi:hypothetical protein ACFY2H_09770 [Streptomyces griseofuscus]|uniref:Lipoprotein n=2 Tax=Streptomyces TaxID=1883 RepID=A0A7H1Q5A8_9ACTN|nr:MULTISPECIES: hypothetical protein [Streptomyces]MBA9045776.1 hypothetical protein [Streptomyces murinus]QNT95488.1 lipoprotein [Streptomyces griseofuscus]BBC96081.1 hypothetical protein SRO_4905 [Streptomyces rochei]
MGAFLWVRARMVAVVGIAVAAGVGVVGCQSDVLGSAGVAYTTGTMASARLEQADVDVSWLNCVGDQGGSAGATVAPGQSAVVSVDCQGETRDRGRITVNGEVTRAVDGACVRGDLRARVGGRQVFHVSGLGDCSAAPGPTYRPPSYPPVGAQPAVTVTVTRTLWCQSDPNCLPVAGK